MADEKLQDVIDEIDKLESDRPSSVEITIAQTQRSIRPKVPDTLLARVIAVLVALAAIASAIREALK